MFVEETVAVSGPETGLVDMVCSVAHTYGGAPGGLGYTRGLSQPDAATAPGGNLTGCLSDVCSSFPVIPKQTQLLQLAREWR